MHAVGTEDPLEGRLTPVLGRKPRVAWEGVLSVLVAAEIKAVTLGSYIRQLYKVKVVGKGLMVDLTPW